MKKTKIICTIGSASDSLSTLTTLLQEGMDIMSLNCSHDSHAEHTRRIATCRQAALAINKPVAIMLDTKGPEIRTLTLKNGKPVTLQENASFIISTNQHVIGDEHGIAVNYSDLAQDVKIGHHILIDDGLIELVVENITEAQIFCRVIISGVLGEDKKVNIPNSTIHLPILSEQDKLDLLLGCQQQVDFIAASFVRNAADVAEIRQFLDTHGGQHIAIIAKIENQAGLDNFDEILLAADGIIVARGDLGDEISIEEVIFAQKMMVEKCNAHAKPIIVSTQMLESMKVNPRPTRAEAGDVTNAIFDGADAVMLSSETAYGRYPIASIQTVTKICQTTDLQFNYDIDLYNEPLSLLESVSHGAVMIAQKSAVTVIVIMTDTGNEAKAIRKYCPTATILALTTHKSTFQQLLLIKGVYPYLLEQRQEKGKENFIQQCHDIVIKTQLANHNDNIIIMSKDDDSIFINMLRLNDKDLSSY